MSRYNTGEDFGNDVSRGTKKVAKVATKGARNKAAKAGAKGAKALGKLAVGVLANPASWLVIVIISIAIILISIVVNTHSGAFNLITHMQEASIENSDRDVSKEVTIEEDTKYAKIATEYLTQEHDVVNEYIKAQARKDNVKFDESSIVDNSTVPILKTSSAMTHDVGKEVAEWCKEIESDNTYKYYSSSENKKCPICEKDNAKKGFSNPGFVVAAYYHGGGVTGIECKASGFGTTNQLSKDTLSTWQDRNGKSWTRIDGNKDKSLIDEKKLSPGDILVVFKDKKCSHLAIYVGDVYDNGKNYVVDAANSSAGIRKVEYSKTGWSGDSYIKYAYHYTGVGKKNAGGKEIAKNAKKYSWAETTINKKAYEKPKSAYSKIQNEYTAQGASNNKGMSGDVLVGVCVQESGYDKSFPIGNYSSAVKHMQKETSKWEKTKAPYQEGDILVLKSEKDLAIYCGDGIIARAKRNTYYPYLQKLGDKKIKDLKCEAYRPCGDADESSTNYEMAAGSREVANIVSAFSIWDAQLIPITDGVKEKGPGISEDSSVSAEDAEAAYSKSIVIGQAASGEGGKLRGCKAGDQSGKEVSTTKWSYSKKNGAYNNWKYVFRAKDPNVALKIAASMRAACDNNHVGYDQRYPDRCTLYDEAKKANWDISSITTDCETTCASVVSVCLNTAGVNVPRKWASTRVYKDLMKTGQFECLTSSKYTASKANLMPGDILCSPTKHTAMVVKSPNRYDTGSSSSVSSSTSYNSKNALIGQASSDIDHKLGDGSGKEVAIGKWTYSSKKQYNNWTYVFRFKDPRKAELAAKDMEWACKNNNIGYNKKAGSLYRACKPYGYDMSKVKKKVGGSCGDVVTLCIRYSGINCKFTGSGLGVAKDLKSRPNDFTCLTDKKYTTSSKYLKRGDVLVTAHPNGKGNHVCMVVYNPKQSTSSSSSSATKETSGGSNAEKLVSMAKKLAYPYSTSSSKYKHPSGSPTKEYLKMYKKYRYGRDSKINYSDCGYCVATVVRAAGIDSSYKGLNWKRNYNSKNDKFKVVHKGPIGNFELKPGDILEYKKTNGNQHTYMYIGNGYTAEGGRGHTYFHISKNKYKCNKNNVKKNTLRVLRAKEDGSSSSSDAQDTLKDQQAKNEEDEEYVSANSALKDIARDLLSRSTFKAILKNTENRRHGNTYSNINPSLLDITYGDIISKNGNRVYSMVEINPASSDTLCNEVFYMDPNAKFTTENPTKLIGTRNSSNVEYEMGNVSVRNAIQTQTDEHLELLYDDINGLLGKFTRLVLPIKKLFTDIPLSKNFASDGSGIEAKFKGSQDIYTCERGKVLQVVNNDPKLGNYVVIEGSYKITYAYMNKITVSKGEIIDRNKNIGTAKDKFRLEVMDEGTNVDPEPLLKLDYSEFEDVGSFGSGIVNGRRTSYPSEGNKFFFSPGTNPFAGTENGPPALYHNCTWYAFGRFSEILGKRANLPTGNAGTWYSNCTAYQKGKTPKLGAIMCWKYNNGGFGHVAVVEEIKPNGDIVASESGYYGGENPKSKSTAYTKFGRVYRKSEGYSMNYGDTFLGFIYQPK